MTRVLLLSFLFGECVVSVLVIAAWFTHVFHGLKFGVLFDKKNRPKFVVVFFMRRVCCVV
jgi:hypothetical protein